MDALDMRLAISDYEDAVDDMLPQNSRLRTPHGKSLIDSVARQMAEADIARNGKLTASPRKYAEVAIQQARQFMGTSHQEAEPEDQEREVAQRRAAPEQDEHEEISNDDYFSFFNDMQGRTQARPRYDEGGE